jgi:hypothetical protein
MQEVSSGLENIRTGARENNAAGDLALVTGYAKILDPTSVVRPSEFTTTEQAQGFFERMGMVIPKFMRGERLAPEVRQRFLATAENLARGKYENAAAEIEPVYRPRAQGLGVNFDEIFRNPFAKTTTPSGQPSVPITPPDVPRTPSPAPAAGSQPVAPAPASPGPNTIPAIPQGMQPGSTVTLPNGTIIRRKQ